MAVAYASKSASSLSLSAPAQNITLPSGTASGELLILHCVTVTALGGVNVVEMVGGTKIINGVSYKNGDGYHSAYLFYKFATSTDISNGYIQVTGSDIYGATCRFNLYRISGSTNSSLLQASADTVASSATPSYGVTLTPSNANSLLMFFVAAVQAVGASASGYAIATDNPSWSEVTDEVIENLGGDDDVLIATAHATRTQTTATGNASLTISQADASRGILLVIGPLDFTSAAQFFMGNNF